MKNETNTQHTPKIKEGLSRNELFLMCTELLKESEQLKRDIEERDREQGRQLKLNAELLEHGKTLVQWCNRHGYVPPCKSQLESVIVKAEGKNLPVS